MKLNKVRTNSSLYIKLLLVITIGVGAILVVSSIVYHYSFTNILLEKTFESDISDLKHTAHSIAITTESAQSVSFQIYRNSSIAKILYYNDPHPFDTQGAMLDLNNYLTSMPFIESIYVYNAAQEKYYIVSQQGRRGVYEEDEFTDVGLKQILVNYLEYEPFTPIPRIIEGASATDESIPVFTYLCYDAISADGKMKSAIAVNISASWINQGISLESTQNDKQVYLIDKKGIAYSVLTLQSLNDTPTIEELILSEPHHEASYLVTNFQKVKSLITYTEKDQFDWYYVRISPYDQITQEIRHMSDLTLKIASVILLIGLLLSWILSKYLYNPIKKITIRMENLESEWRNSSYTIRQNALNKLLQLQSFDPQIQLEKLKRVGIQFNFNEPYHLVFVRLDRYQQLKVQNNQDVVTYKFAIMNIASEICAQHFQLDALDLEDDCLIFFLNLPKNTSIDYEVMTHLMKEIQLASEQYLRIGLTIALTPVQHDPHQIHSLFKQLKEVSLHRFYEGRGAILNLQNYSFHNKVFNLPMSLEKRLIEALKTGKNEEAKQIFDELMLEIKAYPLHCTQLTMNHLNTILEQFTADIEKNSTLQLNFEAGPILPSFEQYETLAELREAYFLIFDHLTTTLNEKRSSKQEDLIRKINGIIEAHYSNPLLSLNYIADELNMSTYHISRVYRQHTLTTIVDVINHIRMQQAKQLLCATELSVAEIALQTGYTSSSYFHRLFKKMYGVTPSEYRSANR